MIRMSQKWKPLAAAMLVGGMVLAAGCSKPGTQGGNVTINGAGSTFIYPVLYRWAYAYQRQHGVNVNYQSIGSGGGIAQIKARTVDFGASDAPLKPEELQAAGLVQFPMIVGGIVPVVHLEDVKPGQLKLTPQALAGIFLGDIRNWNDPAITAQNPGLKLPDKAIKVVHRADGSGTTWIFTNYLAKVSPKWASQVGVGTAPGWPTGMGGKGNEGVAVDVEQTDGAIGYVEFAYAMQNKMTYTKLQNRAGQFVDPAIDSFQAAAANADWAHAPGYYLVLVDQPGAKSWPITGATFILLHKDLSHTQSPGQMLKFFDWAFRNGQGAAKNLYYVPLPDNVVDMVENTWKKELRINGKPAWPAN